VQLQAILKPLKLDFNAIAGNNMKVCTYTIYITNGNGLIFLNIDKNDFYCIVAEVFWSELSLLSIVLFNINY
jgi:hypothetical protein